MAVRYVLIIFAALVALIFFRFCHSNSPTESQPIAAQVEDQGIQHNVSRLQNPATSESKLEAQPVPNNLQTDGANLKPSTQNSVPEIGTATELKKSLSLQEFINKFTKKDLKDWIKDSTPLVNISDIHRPGFQLGYLAGIISTGESEVEFRYNFMGNPPKESSCFSLRHPHSKVIFGSTVDGTQIILKLPVENTFLHIIQNDHFFVEYTDTTKPTYESNEPPSPLLNWTLLYYQRQVDGKIIYRGKIEKLTWPDPEVKLKGTDFCQFAYEGLESQ